MGSPTYLPILKAKKGEFAALQTLRFSKHSEIIPLLEIVPQSKASKEEISTKKAFEEHLHSQAKSVFEIWKGRGNPLLIDTHLLGELAASAMSTIFARVKSLQPKDPDEPKVRLIPVVYTMNAKPPYSCVSEILKEQGEGICCRIPISSPTPINKGTVAAFLKKFRLQPEQVDLLLDAGCISNPDEVLTNLTAKLSLLPLASKWRTLAVAGSSFPKSLGGFKQGISEIERHEWKIWLQIVTESNLGRIPIFSDFGIQNPALPSGGRKGVPNIRYTAGDRWLVFRGTTADTRTPKMNDVAQYKELVIQVSKHTEFCRENYSVGDMYIEDCANGTVPSGNPTKWREVGTNHHITYVVDQIASLADSSKQS
jgi:hypothetical protein